MTAKPAKTPTNATAPNVPDSGTGGVGIARRVELARTVPAHVDSTKATHFMVMIKLLGFWD